MIGRRLNLICIKHDILKSPPWRDVVVGLVRRPDLICINLHDQEISFKIFLEGFCDVIGHPLALIYIIAL